MNYVLLTISMFTMVIKNCIFNTAGKKILKTDGDILKFSSVMFALCAIAFFALTIKEGLSLFTALLGVVFGVATILSNTYSVKALAKGSMHITVLITTASMILPTIFGMIISGESFNVLKMLAIVALIGFIYLSSAKNEKTSVSKKWMTYCAIAFFSSGIVGILQKIHQTSIYKNELSGFLGCSFLVSFVLSVAFSKKDKGEIKFSPKHYILALFCGGCIFAMNFINLKLSGVIPSQIFFPLINGSSIILTSLLSIFIYKEKITKRQLAGLSGGILSLIMICVL